METSRLSTVEEITAKIAAVDFNLIEKAIDSYRMGNLSKLAAILVIDSVINPEPINQDDIAWAIENLLKK